MEEQTAYGQAMDMLDRIVSQKDATSQDVIVNLSAIIGKAANLISEIITQGVLDNSQEPYWEVLVSGPTGQEIKVVSR